MVGLIIALTDGSSRRDRRMARRVKGPTYFQDRALNVARWRTAQPQRTKKRRLSCLGQKRTASALLHSAPVQLLLTILRFAAPPCRLSSSSTFSSNRSVTKRRRREFSSLNCLIWSISPRSTGISVRSVSAAGCDVERAFALRAFRQRWYVMTLIPNDLAMSLCNTPRPAISNAVANFAAISDSVCLCLVTMLPSTPPVRSPTYQPFHILANTGYISQKLRE
jgi:hypothetical protein